jgi:hypothetical protein
MPFLALSVALMAQAAPPPSAAVLIVTLDDARQDQMRYVRELADDVARSFSRREGALIDMVPSAASVAAFQPCIDDLHDGGVRCARFYAARAPAEAAPLVVILVSDAGQADRARPGSAAVRCVSVGAGPTDPVRQDTRVWPGAPMMHGVNEWMDDRAALAGCIAAAAAEAP